MAKKRGKSTFEPVDHKESDAKYAEIVRAGVAQRVGAELLPIDDPAFLVGKWRSSLGLSRRSRDVEHFADGTMPASANLPDAKPGKWRLKGDTYIQTTWVPPMPEYGIDNASWSEEAYRCARISEGQFVYWNGDGSLVITLTRLP
jgi:hypothetical protein